MLTCFKTLRHPFDLRTILTTCCLSTDLRFSFLAFSSLLYAPSSYYVHQHHTHDLHHRQHLDHSSKCFQIKAKLEQCSVPLMTLLALPLQAVAQLLQAALSSLLLWPASLTSRRRRCSALLDYSVSIGWSGFHYSLVGEHRF